MRKSIASSSPAEPTARATLASRSALILLASGDFAFNLYWQTLNLYLLLFYLDWLRLAPALAGTLFMIGAVWDGCADLLAGLAAQRSRRPYRRIIAWSALPLGICFVGTFSAPIGAWQLALIAQIALRTIYAFTNISYLAWTARLASTSSERALVAGLRMSFGALAAVTVAWTLPGLVTVMRSYAAATLLLAGLGVPLLLSVALLVPEPYRPAEPANSVRAVQALGLLARNRAFIALNIAAASGGAAAALATQSVLYFFRYVTADAAAGPRTLALMAFTSLLATPLWTVLAGRAGARLSWLTACGLALGLTAGFLLMHLESAGAATLFLLGMQIAFVGFSVASWALLPDSLEWGSTGTGISVDALGLGVFALVQKCALAVAGFAIGAVYQASGFVAGARQGAASLSAIGWLMFGGPALLVLATLAAVSAFPPRQNTHAKQPRRDH